MSDELGDLILGERPVASKPFRIEITGYGKPPPPSEKKLREDLQMPPLTQDQLGKEIESTLQQIPSLRKEDAANANQYIAWLKKQQPEDELGQMILGTGEPPKPQGPTAQEMQAAEKPFFGTPRIGKRPGQPPSEPADLTPLYEVPRAILQNIPATIASGLGGLVGAALPGPEGQGAAFQKAIQEKLGFEPQAQGSKDILDVLSLPSKAAEYLGNKAFQATGSPVAATLAQVAAEAAPMALGLRGAKAPVQTGRIIPSAPPALTDINVPAIVRQQQQAARTAAPTIMSPEQVAATQAAFEARKAAVAPVVQGTTPVPLAMGLQSGGAAATNKASTVNAIAAEASPELQARIKQISINDVNPDALQTKILEEKHGIDLTSGQRSGNIQNYANEWNNRGAHPDTLGPMFQNQPKQISDALDATREKIAPDIRSVDPSSLGQIQIDALGAKDAARQLQIRNAYKKLEDANAGQFPIDIAQLQQNINNALAQKLKLNAYEDKLSTIKKDIDGLAKKGSMTFDDFENLRTNLADELRSNANGTARAAAWIVRDQLESVPLPANLQSIKPLADQARSLYKERMDVIRANPAYKAAVKEAASAEDAFSQGESLNAAKFHDKYVKNATPEAFRRMKAELADNDLANQSIRAGEIENLKQASGFKGEKGDFRPKGMSDYLFNQREKLRDVHGAEGLKDLMEIDLLGSKIAQPKSGVFNHSNTTSSTIAELAKRGIGTGLEAWAAGASHGVSIPLMTVGKQWFQNAKREAYGKKAVDPYGGLSYKD